MACSTSLPVNGFITMPRTPRRITISRSRSSAEHDRTITARLGLVHANVGQKRSGSRLVCRASKRRSGCSFFSNRSSKVCSSEKRLSEY